MALKSDGNYRLCLDFRKLNSVSKKDTYPLPYMNDILRQLKAAKYISKIDLIVSWAFNQIPLDEVSQKYTAFTVPGRGLFEYKRMPFGLTGAPATFQRLLDRILTPEMRPNVFTYLDNIIVVCTASEEYLRCLDKVHERIAKLGLTINPDKSDFCCNEVKYLGFVVNKVGLKVNPDEVGPIASYPIPRSLKQLH